MSSRKRKKYSKDIKCVFFPDDVKSSVQNVGRETSALSSASSAKSWEKCGDSFLGTPVIKNRESLGRKPSVIRKLAPASASVRTSAANTNEDQLHIAWSSSDSEQSDNETEVQRVSRAVAPWQQCLQRPARPIQSYSRALRMLSSDKDDLPVIDTDSDFSESEEDAEQASEEQISDCESESSDEKPKFSTHKPTNVRELEVSGYVSDREGASGTLDCKSLASQTGEGSRRSVSDWVKFAQAMLQTPQKSLDRQIKTPKDSAKKKRKFQSGGLAERLNRLQCRQRSAVSFWRHQSIADPSATTSVDRPGVLVLEVLEVQEECGMQLVHCELHQLPAEGQAVSQESARVLVLFCRETAAQLIPAPRDIIHIYPPWQSLTIHGFSCDIILNTHFSQKVFSACKPASLSVARGLLSSGRRTPYYLGKGFELEACRTTDKVVLSTVPCSSGASTGHVSLLDAIEGLGQAGAVGQDVEVVVQRVYSIPVPDCSPVSVLKPRAPLRPFADPCRPAEKGKVRLCVLVQDGYGTFSVVQLHRLPCEDDLPQYCKMWQGKTCLLRGIKVVQRVTRERCTRLFSLIDSLWPPVVPLQDPANTSVTFSESRAAGPAPSFCYLLSGEETSVQPTEEPGLCPLYLPPAARTLQDVLQSEEKTCRWSFVATVLYKRMQRCDVGRGEVWLALTDPSLQEEHLERPCRRTVALCVCASCALTSSVLEALKSPAACRMSFRDAVKEHGVLLCVEQSVLEVCSVHPGDHLQSTSTAESLPQTLAEPRAQTLPQPVRLDPLSLDATPNSLCSLSGVIVGVDESTAYSWPACSHCGSENLEILAGSKNYYCAACKSAMDKPDTKMQLDVFLSCPTLSNCTLKVKLLQRTIASVLNTAVAVAPDGDEFPGYDVENVLGKEVGPLAAYVRVVTRKPALWIGLEEICL
ncbi:DNA repair-scaffolding protein isoform X2 [Betta splendens]|uniref:DNA repair-scaffolding protein isoform X2 n=1 Tax=Betta splendens TaxID=158456 RepID=A0A6P7KYH8_BETSP|nr:DNA repair-scaffolding protein isoform X2 [Betta splendens]